MFLEKPKKTANENEVAYATFKAINIETHSNIASKVKMSRKVTLIEDIPVEKPHDAVQEFIENVLQKQLDTPSTSIRCALPKSDEEVKLARENSVPSSTRNDTKYCCKVWSEWAYNRNKFCIATNSLAPEDPATVDIDSLAYWLERFVLEIRTKDGNEYNPNSLQLVLPSGSTIRELMDNSLWKELGIVPMKEYEAIREQMKSRKKTYQIYCKNNIKLKLLTIIRSLVTYHNYNYKTARGLQSNNQHKI